jgi:hypothetical protein
MIDLPASGRRKIPCPASASISVLFPDPGPSSDYEQAVKIYLLHPASFAT